MAGHRKRIKHVHEPGDLHEFTFSCYRRKPLLTSDDWLRRLAVTIDNAGRDEQFELVAFVFMPDHVHLLTRPTENVPRFGHYPARVKQPFSRQVKEILIASHALLLDALTVRERPGKTCFRFWQEGPGYDRNLFTRNAILASIDYLHAHPVLLPARGRVFVCPFAVDDRTPRPRGDTPRLCADWCRAGGNCAKKRSFPMKDDY